jgi:hypothetical protein
MKWQRKWLSAFDWIKLCTGNAAELGLHSDTVQTICREFAARGIRFDAAPAGAPPRRALMGCRRAVQVHGANVTYPKTPIPVLAVPRDRGDIKSGFRADARGR